MAHGPTTPGAAPRLVPDAPLPPYSYVTGRFPHPVRDPRGHSFGHATAPPPPVNEANWQTSRDYLLGCDLFNFGYYWEAHETWESLWHASGRRGATADFLKGLIKLAAAGVKAREGRLSGVRRHAARAAQLLAGVRDGSDAATFLGFDLAWLIESARELAMLSELPAATDAAVQVVFTFRLLPQARS